MVFKAVFVCTKESLVHLINFMSLRKGCKNYREHDWNYATCYQCVPSGEDFFGLQYKYHRESGMNYKLRYKHLLTLIKNISYAIHLEKQFFFSVLFLRAKTTISFCHPRNQSWITGWELSMSYWL